MTTAPAYIDIVSTSTLNPIEIFSSVVFRIHGFLRANPTIKIGITFPQMTYGVPNPIDRALMQKSRANVGPVLRVFAPSTELLLKLGSAIDLKDLQHRALAYVSYPQLAPSTPSSVSTQRTRFTYYDTKWTSVDDKSRKSKALKEFNSLSHTSAYFTFHHDNQSYTQEFSQTINPSPALPNFENLNSYGLSTPSNPCFFPSF